MIKSKLFKYSFAISFIIHSLILFWPPEFTLKINFKQEEKVALKKIEKTLKEISKPTLTKNKYQEIQEEYRKVLKNRLLEAKERVKKARQTQDKMKDYTRYTKEDKKVLEKFLKEAQGKITKEALLRTQKEELEKKLGGRDSFGGFIPKVAQIDKEEKTSSILKIKLIEDNGKKTKHEEEKVKQEKCNKENTYYGIGVAFQESTRSTMEDRLERGFWKITTVAPGYSADNYDIRVGDHLLGAFDHRGHFYEGANFIKDNKRFIGKKMRILLNRNGRALEKEIPINKVCFSLKKN